MKALHPGGSVPLSGFHYDTLTSLVAPVDGSAVMKSNGTILAGLFVHQIAGGGQNYTLEWTTDATFVGPISYDFNGDYSMDATLPYKPIDCHAVPLP